MISEVADELNVECYVIGGFVRDLFLQRKSEDIDVVVIGSGIELAEKLSKRIKGSKLSVFKNFGTAQIKWKNLEVEFVGARKESYRADSRKPIVEDGTLEDDQNRRDFTINALALCLNKERFGELIDPFDGISDIKNKIIKTPLNPDVTFNDDPLRMMRCIRFSAQLQFYIEENTFEAISRVKERISIISKERIVDELNKIMASKIPSIGFELLKRSGLLELIMPDLYKLCGIEEKGGRAHKDNFLHTMQVLDSIASKSDNLWLRWAALFHDIGKPVSKRWDNRVGWTFHNHDFVGAKMIPKIFSQMKLPQNEKMKYVQKMVALHMRPIALVEEEVTDSAVRRLLFDAGDDIEDLMLLCDADITSKNLEKVRRYQDNYRIVRNKLTEIEQKDKIRNFQPPVSGEEIMKVFDLTPCREIGVIKNAIKDAVLDGEIANEHDAAYQYMLKKAAELGLHPKNV
ncbi:MAG: HD domain-containing protein [Paludibacteraceae bacterium]|nr:HD domain-containing protein [Paludibacteraceae bacterium]MBQ9100195.1 HD domain-containing protein [Paludibacteraceae bacterium]MBR6658899.1 HD domain-containing protein [Paludibacteraceae bacterium]